MSFTEPSASNIELDSDESKVDDKRVLQLGITLYNSTPFKEFDVMTGKWEGGKTYLISWAELLELQTSINEKVEFLQPLIDSGKLTVK